MEKINKITGRIVRADNGLGIENLKVVVFDIDSASSITRILADNGHISPSTSPSAVPSTTPALEMIKLLFGPALEEDSELRGDAPSGDRLGSVLTASDGSFEIEFDDSAFNDEGKEKRPDILLAVIGPDTSIAINGHGYGLPEFKRLVHLSLYTSWNAGRQESFFLRIPETLFEISGLNSSLQPKKLSTADTLKKEYQEKSKELKNIQKVRLDFMKEGLKKEKNLKTKSAKVVANIFKNSVEDPDNPFFISGSLSKKDRQKKIKAAKEAAISKGEERLSAIGNPTPSGDIVPKPLSVYIPEDILDSLLPTLPIDNTGGLPDSIDIEVEALCGLINATVNGKRLVRSKDIYSLINKNSNTTTDEQDDDDSSNTDDVDVSPDLSDLSPQERIQYLIEEQVKDVVISQPVDPHLPPSTLARLRVDLDNAIINPGPADTTSFRDYHSLQIAYENIWAESLSIDVKFLARLLYETTVMVNRETNAGQDRVLEQEFNSIEELIDVSHSVDEIDEFLSESIKTTNPILTFTRFYPEISKYWILMTGQEQLQANMLLHNFIRVHESIIGSEAEFITEIETFLATIFDDFGTDDFKRKTQREIKSRLKRLITELGEALSENYRFDHFVENSINYGIISTYRQTIKPGKYQVGSLKKTLPLAPGQTNSYEVTQTVKSSRARKEIENNAVTRSSESAITSRLETEVLQRAEEITNFSTSTTGGLSFGIGSINNTTAFSANKKNHSQETKKASRDAVLKTAQEMKSEHNLELNTSEEVQYTGTEKSEIKNPNNELTVTYLLYELERQYKVSEKIHALTPVIMVAQEMPKPDDITEAWLLRHDWIIKRVLLDKSFLQPLRMLRESFVSDEISIGVKKSNWETQLRIVSNLEAEEKKWLASRRELHEQMVDAQYLKAQAEARDAQEGFLKKLTDATFIDPDEIEIGYAQAAIDRSKSMLEMVEAEFGRTAERLAVSRDALNNAARIYSDAVEKITQRRTLIDQLRIHVKDNILHYMQAIWSYEPNDQRYYRLYKNTVFSPNQSRFQVRVRRATEDDINSIQLPGAPVPNVVIEELGSPIWNPSGRSAYKKLHEVADIDSPLGFKGNYMLFPLKECNLITDYMMSEFVDGYFGIRDPDALSEFTNEELAAYAKTLNEEQAKKVHAIIAQRLDTSHRDEDTIVMPTGQIYMEALVGTHTLLEPFKLAHRGYDALAAREELRRKGLENLRYAARMTSATPDFEDPDVDKNVKIKGGNGIIVDTD